MSFKTAHNQVHGLGSAHDGTHHFLIQRITAIALIPLAILFICPFARAVGAGHGAVLDIYSNWWNAFIAAAFLVVALRHMALGLQVVIEDYVPAKGTRTVLLLCNTIFSWGFAAAGVFAVARIAFIS